jgi:hypothetical protein
VNNQKFQNEESVNSKGSFGLDEKRVLRNELQWQVTKLRILHPCHGHAALPGSLAEIIITS